MALVLLYRIDWPHNSGDDAAGIVHSVGKDVYNFKPGDRVATLHKFGKEAWEFRRLRCLPRYHSLTYPLKLVFRRSCQENEAAFTAAIALFVDMVLLAGYDLRSKPPRLPLMIYGVTSAAGAFARISGLGHIIGIAGRPLWRVWRDSASRLCWGLSQRRGTRSYQGNSRA